MSKKVLLVDDEPDLRLIIKAALRQAGYEITEAVSGEEALALLASDRFDVMLLDLGLPGIDGWDVIARLDAATKPPVLLLTASVSLEVSARAMRAGCSGYLSKPFQRGELEREVARLVE